MLAGWASFVVACTYLIVSFVYELDAKVPLASFILVPIGVCSFGSCFKYTTAMAFGGLVWMAAKLYATELYPTSLRSMANAFSSVIGRIGTMIAPQILLLK
jgi:hypothetical protein